MFGIANLICVSIELKGESDAIDTDLFTYLFMCINGRVGFVPFIANIRDPDYRKEHKVLNLGNINGNCFGIEFQFEYLIDNHTLTTFSNAIKTLPKEKEQDCMTIDFGNTAKSVGVVELMQLQKAS